MLDPSDISDPILVAHGVTLNEVRAPKHREHNAARRALIMAMRPHYSIAEIAAFVDAHKDTVMGVVRRKGAPKVGRAVEKPKAPTRGPVKLALVGRGMRDAQGPKWENCKHYSQCLDELLKRERAAGRFPERAACPALCKWEEPLDKFARIGDRKAVET